MNKQALDSLILKECGIRIILVNQQYQVEYINDTKNQLNKEKDIILLTKDLFPDNYISSLHSKIKSILDKEVTSSSLIMEVKSIDELSYIQLDLTPMIIDEKLKSVLIKEKDITKQVQAENDLDSVYKHSKQEIFIFSVKNFNFLEVNKKAMNNLGYTLNEIKSMRPWDIKSKFTEQTFREKIKPLIDGKVEKLEFETHHLRKDGTTYPVEVHLCISNFKGKSVFEAMVLDRTENKKLQYKLLHLTKLSSIGELAAGVGHEINNPLAIAAGNLFKLKKNLTKKSIIDEELKLIISRQSDAIDRIRVIVDGLRTYARVENYDDAEFDVKDAIRSTTSLVSEIYQSEDISINVEMSNDKQVIDGNIGKFNQVLMNILSNSKDAILEKGKGTISIKSYADNEKVYISISDNGVGMNEKTKKKVFDAFFTTKKVGKGTGMGMGIIDELVKSMAGHLELESKENIGTTIRLEFNLASQNLTKKSINENVSIDPQNGSLTGTALVLDDEIHLIEIFKEMLEDFGLQVYTASNGKDALEIVKENKLDYIITDLRMPQMSGEEFIDEAKKLPNGQTKYFVISGGDPSEFSKAKKETLLSKVQAYITKPFSSEYIYKVLSESQS